MGNHDKQRLAYDFLQARIGQSFAIGELAKAAGWGLISARTYISKNLKGLVEKDSKSKKRLRVRREFRRITFEQYVRLADQTRRVFQTYDRNEYGGIVTFEFLLPLTQESKLTRALDDIFYEDTIAEVLLEVGGDRFAQWAERDSGWTDAEYAAEIAKRAGAHFGGYSISHVAGRFRAAPLATRRGAGRLFEKDRPYLMDETTASVRFIVPLSSTKEKKPKRGAQLVLPVEKPAEAEQISLKEEVEFIRTLFFALFVEALIRNVTGEDQIWLIEDTPLGRRLHVWEPE